MLFVAEAVTLAQVVRLATLARALDPARYEVHFASAHFDELIFAGTAFIRHHDLLAVARPRRRPRRVAAVASTAGGLCAATSTRSGRCSARCGPSLVVGDLRLSLSVSAPLEARSLRRAHQRLLEPARGRARTSRSPIIRS